VRTLNFWMLLAAGGVTGTFLRYAVSGWIGRATGGIFPWGTTAVNVLGCFFIGAAASYVERGGLLNPALRSALLIGVLGSFTTYSTFGLETFNLIAAAQWARVAGYVLLVNVGGLAGVWAGFRLMQVV